MYEKRGIKTSLHLYVEKFSDYINFSCTGTVHFHELIVNNLEFNLGHGFRF